jgi:hypothetical protein
MTERRSCKMPARSGMGPVAQLVFKTSFRPTRSDPPGHDLAGFAGISPALRRDPNTLEHAGIGFSGGQEMDIG